MAVKFDAGLHSSLVSTHGDNLLEVTDLAVTFDIQEGLVQAVDGISFGIRQGETVGLVGESGCGKSISALAILGLVRMMGNATVTGKVEFMGRDLLALPERDVRRVRGRDMAMIFQDPVTSLNPVLSIERQTTEGMENHLGLSHSDAVKRAIELLEMVGIPKAAERIHDYPHQFSGGMRQRVMIAIALSCNPKLLLADEPTTALDVTIQAQIRALMKQLSPRLRLGHRPHHATTSARSLACTERIGDVRRQDRRVGGGGRAVRRPSPPLHVGRRELGTALLDEPRKGSLHRSRVCRPTSPICPGAALFAARPPLRSEAALLRSPSR